MNKSYSCMTVLGAIVLLSSIAAAATTSTDPIVDDSAMGWIWNGMDAIDDSSFHGGSGHAGGPGSYGAFTFNGTGVDVFAMSGPTLTVDGRHHKIGSLKVSIDGSLKAVSRLYRTDGVDDIDAFTITGLAPGNHVLQVEPDGGWSAIDYISVRGSVEPGASPATTTGSTGTADSDNPSTSTAGNLPSHIPDGKTIALQSSANNMYVSVVSTLPLQAASQGAGSGQEFVVSSQGGDYVTLRSVISHKCICVSPADHALYAARPDVDTSVGGGEMFHWETNSDGTVSLKSYSTHMYVSTSANANDSGFVGLLTADRQTVNELAKFKVTSP